MAKEEEKKRKKINICGGWWKKKKEKENKNLWWLFARWWWLFARWTQGKVTVVVCSALFALVIFLDNATSRVLSSLLLGLLLGSVGLCKVSSMSLFVCLCCDCMDNATSPVLSSFY
jgi:hypothetical protein